MTEINLTEMKSNIWMGWLYEEIAEKHKVSVSYISRVVKGRNAFEIPWPDGSFGPLPARRKEEIKAERKRRIRLSRKDRRATDRRKHGGAHTIQG